MVISVLSMVKQITEKARYRFQVTIDIKYLNLNMACSGQFQNFIRLEISWLTIRQVSLVSVNKKFWTPTIPRENIGPSQLSCRDETSSSEELIYIYITLVKAVCYTHQQNTKMLGLPKYCLFLLFTVSTIHTFRISSQKGIF